MEAVNTGIKGYRLIHLLGTKRLDIKKVMAHGEELIVSLRAISTPAGRPVRRASKMLRISEPARPFDH
jgi:hypothetical protein